ncbi:DsbA family protein [Neobacillus jeddahensis]|uniref:DsbA family protein n=1 Tax=Neobacillus jeddahensis TaxID=1461580 RepID=UPI00058D90FE|nr:DsbA family protein [Neobacillus jeddahensis]
MAKDMKNSKKQQQSSSKFAFWVIGLVAVCILALIFFEKDSKDKEESTENDINYSQQPFLGEESAPVSIIEFGDYKCPNCKNFLEQVVPVIEKELVDTGKAKFYFMNDAFINVDSTRSAKFAESVYQELGNETFWKFHDQLYAAQPEEPEKEKMDVFTEDFLIITLKEVANDTDVDKVVENFRADQSKKAFDTDMEYAEKLDVTGTPTIFVDGKKFEGQTIDDLKDMVAEAAKNHE